MAFSFAAGPNVAAAQSDVDPDIVDGKTATEENLIEEEELLFAPIPEWAKTAEIPSEQTAATKGMAGSFALVSHQHRITDKGGTYFMRQVIRVSEASALNDLGTISLNWVPGREKVTLHHLAIIRDGQRLNILENGQTFEYLRREPNLSQGILDGKVTATLLIEDLRVGDMIDLARSVDTSYEPLVGHYQFMHNYAGTLKIDRLMQRVIWPEDRHVLISHGSGLPPYESYKENGYEVREFSVDAIDEKAMPKDLPERFYFDRVSQISTFDNWQNVAARFQPLFDEAAIVPPEGSLRDVVEELRAEQLDSKALVERVLAKVQNDVRYVGNFSGLGNYTPQSAQSVWSSKYGDCKGKTALLTAILREFDLEATPVLVHAKGFEPIDSYLAAPHAFNHIFVRLTMNGETYWLDGTRQDDTSLDRLPPVFFGHMLPLDSIAEPVYVHDANYDRLQSLDRYIIDASAGLEKPARYRIEQVRYDDAAKRYISKYGHMTDSEKARVIEDFVEDDDNRDSTLESFNFYSEPDKLSAMVVYEGTTIMPWIEGNGFQKYLAKHLNLGRHFHFDREDAEYNDLPRRTSKRHYANQVEIIFPEDYGAINIEGQTYDKQIGPAHYIRRLSKDKNRFTGYLETAVGYREYTAEQAIQWDSETDLIFDDRVYVAYAPKDSPAISSLQSFNSAIQQAHDIAAANGDTKDIHDVLDPLIQTDPNNVRLLVTRAKLIMDEQPMIAERDLLRALLLERSNLEALQTIAQLYIDNSETALARKMLDRILRRTEEHPWALQQREALNLSASELGDNAQTSP
ncbi:DUF3857 domain-containing protein [Alterisphingorhabdus coralli]|uniref:DUF3857 domain-containing protein n=1 Tax=Alterisphingorhabdus coralli TaxID=3071408 RepID=A0AA97F605_9SPHN|nr:DUF3857 domain-containing protein [Parasphingorhabdus sp. SCSIO 66989]WOE74979.1 DUF3857 domain-containing protein [Parasphingorhabdus sp. SCSIO 66989]